MKTHDDEALIVHAQQLIAMHDKGHSFVDLQAEAEHMHPLAFELFCAVLDGAEIYEGAETMLRIDEENV